MKDIFGKALWHAFKTGKPTIEIIERDDGYITKTDVRKYFKKYRSWPKCERNAMKYVKGKILDIGCGAGRHLLWLQKKGFDVTGIDISPLAIKICKSKGAKNVKVMSLFNLKFKPKSFDTIIMMFNNFGLAGNVKETKKMLKNFYRITTKDAILIVSSRDVKGTKKLVHLNYHKLNIKRGRPIGQVTLRSIYKDEKSGWWDLLMVTPREMKEILKGTGWKISKIIRGYTILGATGEYLAILKKR